LPLEESGAIEWIGTGVPASENVAELASAFPASPSGNTSVDFFRPGLIQELSWQLGEVNVSKEGLAEASKIFLSSRSEGAPRFTGLHTVFHAVRVEGAIRTFVVLGLAGAKLIINLCGLDVIPVTDFLRRVMWGRVKNVNGVKPCCECDRPRVRMT